ncbi:MAG: hypothetical protein MUE51_15130 [Thermoleophilia bacterium]|nr:hypothetical protein [Thermoleophilia bacterium]
MPGIRPLVLLAAVAAVGAGVPAPAPAAVPSNEWTLSFDYSIGGALAGGARVTFRTPYRAGVVEARGPLTLEGPLGVVTGEFVLRGRVADGVLAFVPQGTATLTTADVTVPLDLFQSPEEVAIPLDHEAEWTREGAGTHTVFSLSGTESHRITYDVRERMNLGHGAPGLPRGHAVEPVSRWRFTIDVDVSPEGEITGEARPRHLGIATDSIPRGRYRLRAVPGPRFGRTSFAVRGAMAGGVGFIWLTPVPGARHLLDVDVLAGGRVLARRAHAMSRLPVKLPILRRPRPARRVCFQADPPPDGNLDAGCRRPPRVDPCCDTTRLIVRTQQRTG